MMTSRSGRRLPFYVLDAFTDTPFAGNPAGVFLNADGLTDETMRRLAAELSLESAFVLAPDADGSHDLRLRFFTGTTEVPLCGHATVSALVALAHAGRVSTPRVSEPPARLRVATNAGVLAADLTAPGPEVTLFQAPPRFGLPLGADEMAEVAAALGMAPGEIAATGLPAQRVSTGSPFLFVPVATRGAVDRAPADLAAIARLSRAHESLGVYVFRVESNEGEDRAAPVSTWGRCFAPAAGLDEDPVTGSASGALGCFLVRHGVLPPAPGGTATFTARQGFAGGRGGSVHVSVETDERGEIRSVAVTGSALLVAEGEFAVP
jgi:PhzF family phenazine biosynthesis protein